MKQIKYFICIILIVMVIFVFYKKRSGIYHLLVYKYQGFGLLTIHESSNKKIDNILTSCSLIAHAGGGIDGIKYTNSKEALQKSIDNGYRLIELDLLVSSDGKILGAHDWERYVDKSSLTNFPPESYEFVSAQYLDKYTTMDIEMINEVFLSNENLILVTDKIRDIGLLSQSIPYKNRMIVEVFSVFDFNLAIENGLHPALNIDIRNQNMVDFVVETGIKRVTYRGDQLHEMEVAYRNAKRLSDNGILSMIYSRNDLDVKQIQGDLGIKGSFYVDFYDNGRCD
ncbi:hypothetical protein [Pseudoalteromonas sp. MMG012]|uniref:hypothetical protein n=1 Tax=Pseudoalteromonas sp. MMG012 TaxID=2822686 RepID=UPI001B3A0699|nr:hypothetical protein [Pseudoalteromonas sp. MMG012]MBQ4852934.1 hypothetical protein [Pseudoalteromonas sp. MMG012]